ncbi:unnamed protein product [Phytophthora fragariaefolia]|uniref:Unnamed protein product n=1 Tax=Phytophthora fragariaefolia TaxID=1490495 RepID=A0A9W7CVT6_9STRA|nr:unnamed protein product [Phytophthora fragariaefolia]
MESAAGCPICGKSGGLKRCGACKAVGYCSRQHQRLHWRAHRATCRQSTQLQSVSRSSAVVIVVEIKSGQGDGLTNPMVQHLFDSLFEAKSYVQERLGYSRLDEMKELTEMPFLTKFMRFSSAWLYVNPRCNVFAPLADKLAFQRVQPLLQRLQQLHLIDDDSEQEKEETKYYCYGPNGAVELNAMVIFFGCSIPDGFSRFLNARGDSFFIGTTAQHQPVTSNILWGAANFLRDAMGCYSDSDMAEEKRNDVFVKWGWQYSRGTWQPASGDDRINLYETNPFRCAVGWPVVDHRDERF